MRLKKLHIRLIAAVLITTVPFTLASTSCSPDTQSSTPPTPRATTSAQDTPGDSSAPVSDTEMNPEMPTITGPPAVPIVLEPVASGENTESNENGVIDYSNASDGYVMIKWDGGPVEKGLRIQIDGPSGVQYTYVLNADGKFEVFPLSDENGSYTVRIVDLLEDGRGAVALSATINVTLVDEFAPFLRPNQYVNFTKDSKVVVKAAELVSSESDFIEKIGAIYNFVIHNISYDVDLANEIVAGMHTNYLPDLDSVYNKKKGICFDFAAVMAAMLRSQGIPTKLVTGKVSGDLDHAWLNVYSEQEGWIEAVILFDGGDWQMVDPTFASSGSSAAALRDFIGDGSNYVEMKLY